MTNPKATPETLAEFMQAVRARWNFEEYEFNAIEQAVSDPECYAVLRSTAPQAGVSDTYSETVRRVAAAREKGYAAARANIQEAWAALSMIRETVETLAPSDSVKAAEHLDGPTFMHEADALVAGIIALSAPAERLTGEAVAWQMKWPDGEWQAIVEPTPASIKQYQNSGREVRALYAAPALTAGTERENIERCAKLAETIYSRLFPKPRNRIDAESIGHIIAAEIRALALSAAPAASGADKQERKA